MSDIAKIAGVLCMAVMAMGVLYDLGSFKVTDKTIKFVISVYILVTVFNALKGAKLEISTNELLQNISVEDNSGMLKNEVVKQTEKELEEVIKNRLDEKKISYNDVSLHILEQNGSLIVSEIKIVCSDDMSQAAKECINDFITEETKVITGE